MIGVNFTLTPVWECGAGSVSEYGAGCARGNDGWVARGDGGPPNVPMIGIASYDRAGLKPTPTKSRNLGIHRYQDVGPLG